MSENPKDIGKMDKKAPESVVKVNEKENQRQKNKYKEPRFVRGSRIYRKECTVRIDNIPNWKYSATKVIEILENLCGENTILAVVPSENKLSYEVTTDDEDTAIRMTNGVEIGEDKFNCIFQFNDVVVVSIMHLPAYMDDEEILQPLINKGCEIKSDLFRHVHPRTQVADGTRYVHVKFPPGMVSLPWSMKFETGLGPKFFELFIIIKGHCVISVDPRITNTDNVRSLFKDDGICPYCRGKPCVCYCAECKQHYNDCSCGVQGTTCSEIDSNEQVDEIIQIDENENEMEGNDEALVLGQDGSDDQLPEGDGEDNGEANMVDELDVRNNGDKISREEDNENSKVPVQTETKTSEEETKEKVQEKKEDDSDNELSLNVKNVNDRNDIVINVDVHKCNDTQVDNFVTKDNVEISDNETENESENLESMETDYESFDENSDNEEHVSGCVDGATETFWDIELVESIEQLYNGKILMSNGINRRQGVAILVSRKYCENVKLVHNDEHGRFIHIEFQYNDIVCNIINIYAPNNVHERVEFFSFLQNYMLNFDNIIIGGDWNTTLSDLDRCTKTGHKVDNAFRKLEHLMNDSDLYDIWRFRNPKKRVFSRRK
ncbi:unnamed protein product [Mytilus edulis]|uniref:Endonuclease/exonuclease/phosphatase domain-containing protein n=1 Tax=Mytilus edulis TaxID=6550 RepID=A0A8S3U2F7_MYTED|nr:unnamed protein product [Mytilus edulis]